MTEQARILACIAWAVIGAVVSLSALWGSAYWLSAVGIGHWTGFPTVMTAMMLIFAGGVVCMAAISRLL